MIKIDVTKRLLTAEGALSLTVEMESELNGCTGIMGISGSGKTTLLRMLAGLTNPDSGRIEVAGRVWYDNLQNINVPVQERRIGFVFQDYSLFPNMSVHENVAFSCKDHKKIEALLEMAGLGRFRDFSPDQLSGGQKQRVALVRALARDPELLLLDEPLSALDNEAREKLQDDLLEIQNRFGTTTFLVSHDEMEIRKLCSSVAVIENGKLAAMATPEEMFTHRPQRNKFSYMGKIHSIKKLGDCAMLVVGYGKNKTKVMLRKEDLKTIMDDPNEFMHLDLGEADEG